VAAVDYFPQVEQVEVMEWVERLTGQPIGLGDPRVHFRQGGPRPLSDGRFTTTASQLVPSRRVPNPNLPRPGDSSPAFPLTEPFHRTTTALVGAAAAGSSFQERADWNRSTSWLPDAASDVFAPGWDVSRHSGAGREFYASYGLGSPFPEDAKLCAALNSFWPAVAPDSSRTYGFRPDGRPLNTSIPLLDAELGYHASHPRVAAGEATPGDGWDGDCGPFFETVDNRDFVNASDPERADLTRTALDGRVGFSGLDKVDGRELVLRMEALRVCTSFMQDDSAQVVLLHAPASGPWLVTVERVEKWSSWASKVLPRAPGISAGLGYVFVFAQVDWEHRVPVGDPPLRRRFPVVRRVEFQLVVGDGVPGTSRPPFEEAFWSIDRDPFKSVPNLARIAGLHVGPG